MGLGIESKMPQEEDECTHVEETVDAATSHINGNPPRESPHVGGEVEAQYSVPQFCNHPMFYYVPGSRFEITTTAIYGTWYGKPNSEQPRNALKS